MITFVNAKINLGLNITGKRPDGYHNLETVFYPVGVLAGTPADPSPFGDILEIVAAGTAEDTFRQTGRQVDCPPEKNLVWRALQAFRTELQHSGDCRALPAVEITLDKHLPDGAGLGGGSADASFTLLTLNRLCGGVVDDRTLHKLALSLGADCPFFLENRCCYASGVGEKLQPLPLSLAGKWCLVAKPDIYISTAQAFGGITPAPPRFDLRHLPALPLEEWRGKVANDFETTLFPRFPRLAQIKGQLYDGGARYASLSGSGSSLYGIFDNLDTASACGSQLASTQTQVWLLLLS